MIDIKKQSEIVKLLHGSENISNEKKIFIFYGYCVNQNEI